MLLLLSDDRAHGAVERIFADYYTVMYKNAYKILQNRHDAEDAVMDAFLRITDHADKFLGEDEEALCALVMIYLRNAAKTLYRKRKLRTSLSLTVYADEEDFDVTLESDEPWPLQRVIDRETVDLLAQALEELPEEQRDALLLRHYYDYSYEEIARALGQREGAVRARVFRAKNKLKEIMGEEFYERIRF